MYGHQFIFTITVYKFLATTTNTRLTIFPTVPNLSTMIWFSYKEILWLSSCLKKIKNHRNSKYVFPNSPGRNNRQRSQLSRSTNFFRIKLGAEVVSFHRAILEWPFQFRQGRFQVSLVRHQTHAILFQAFNLPFIYSHIRHFPHQKYIYG